MGRRKIEKSEKLEKNGQKVSHKTKEKRISEIQDKFHSTVEIPIKDKN